MDGIPLDLTIATPLEVAVNHDEAISLRAEDESGSFGIRPGHADFITMLAPSVVRWSTPDGAWRFCAVDGGVMTVSGGRRVAIACREAIVGDSMERLEHEVARVRATQLDAARRARVEAVRLHAQAVRQMLRYLRGPMAPDGQDVPAAQGRGQ
ncbi:MAG: F0F1 ATP synthase subunit epsilon [Paraburkholderia sp.]|uniref:F0F1 ATP synthase subunit epsilon n=1 Tax=Paraburkholderia sp. TaxID=1926495 RepID=UPI00122628F5|nr:F0F1 ATP synthase subunit epsilon [Paraburkholderia sp.]TAM04413.1 MAG: F0F1 ATP synthase subunit epsilon [Paraburkholderia sp.]TAM32808.1 MAG: F0F1 ATP synthase subunit epsilon [Paraburkholderia sp.]